MVHTMVKDKDFFNDKKSIYKKMEHVSYNELKTQNYLLNNEHSIEEQKLIFTFRTRMAQFGENYKAGRDEIVCPLCRSHKDSQSMMFECPIVKKELIDRNITNDLNLLDDVYHEDISRNTIDILKIVTELRSNVVKN